MVLVRALRLENTLAKVALLVYIKLIIWDHWGQFCRYQIAKRRNSNARMTEQDNKYVLNRSNYVMVRLIVKTRETKRKTMPENGKHCEYNSIILLHKYSTLNIGGYYLPSKDERNISFR